MLFDIDCNHFLTFRELARHGSASDAAKALRTNVSKISRDIKALENSLNAVLFFRRKNGFELTPDGLILLDKTRDIETHYQDISKYFLGGIREEHLDLNFITTKGYSGYYTGQLLIDFLKNNTEVNLRLFTTDSNINESNFYGDISISNQRISVEGFEEIKVSEGIWKFAASKEYLEKFGYPSKLDDLRSHKLITFDLGYHGNKKVVDWFLEEVQVEPNYKINNIYTILSFVEKHMGVGFVPENYIKENCENVVILEQMPSRHLCQYLTYKKKSLDKKSVQLFFNFLYAEKIIERLPFKI